MKYKILIIGILSTLLLIGGKILPPIYINRIIILLIGYSLIYTGILINATSIKNIVESILIYNNLYQIIGLGLLIKIFIYFSAFILNFIGEIVNIRGNVLKSAEYNTLTLLSLLGMITLIESTDLISIYLSIELISFPLYIISALYNNYSSQLGINKDNQSGIKAGLKYLLLGSFTSTFILAGLIMLYYILGLTNFNEIGILINTGILNDNYIYESKSIYRAILMTYIFILSGLLFKIGSVPFHNWSPDVYDGVPTIVTSWISILPKVCFIIIIAILNIKIFQFIPNSFYIFIFSSFASLIIGSILGLSQYRIKRLLSYSSIAQIGFILLGLSIIESSSIHSILFYLIQYTFTSINIFLILMSLNKYSNIEVIGQFKNLLVFNPFLSTSFMICFFSFAGVPPFIGFFGKLDILFQSIHFGYFFLTFIAIITSVITAAYYLRIIKISHFDLTSFKSTYYLTGNISINNFIAILTSFITFYILLFNFNPSETFSLLSMGLIPISKNNKNKKNIQFKNLIFFLFLVVLYII